MRGAVGGIAARVALRRPTPAGRIIQAELPALAQEPLVEPAAGRPAQARRIYDSGKELLQRHLRSIGIAWPGCLAARPRGLALDPGVLPGPAQHHIPAFCFT